MSYGTESSNLEINSRRAPHEMEAAQLLGLLLIGFSRLDLALQLYVAALPREVTKPSTGPAARLPSLLAFADTLADKALRAEFVRWIVRVRQQEPLAQCLRYARWLPDPRRNTVLLLGQPGDPLPSNRSFTIGELERAVVEQKELLVELHRLCALERGLTASSASAFLSTQPIDVVEQVA